jgi:hypothetical protein
MTFSTASSGALRATASSSPRAPNSGWREPPASAGFHVISQDLSWHREELLFKSPSFRAATRPCLQNRVLYLGRPTASLYFVSPAPDRSYPGRNTP